MRRAVPPAMGAMSTAVTRLLPHAPTIAEPATNVRPAARACAGSKPVSSLAGRASTIAPIAMPAACNASAAAYALSLLVKITAREPGRTP